MICDEARIHTLAEIGGEGEDAESRAHLAACSPCADYRREAEQVWQVSGRAVELCPRRPSLLQERTRRRAPAAAAAAAAMLIAGVAVLAWTLRPAPSGTPGQDPDAKGEELLQKDPELRKQLLRTAVQEKERLAEFEKKLIEAEYGFAEVKALADARKTKDACDRAEALLTSFPHLQLVILDPAELRFRAAVLRVRIKEMAWTLKLTLLREKPAPEDAPGLGERAAVEIQLMNELRGFKRSLEELAAQGPQPRKNPTVELGGPDTTLRANTLDKLRSIRITVDMAGGSMKDVVAYLREISGLNMVLAGTKEEQARLITIKLADTVVEALLDHLTNLAGYKWEVDRFGILVFYPAQK